jgi:peptide deformylase
MTILDIRLFPDPVLREVATEVKGFDPELDKLVMDMAETMYTASGIGLAAPQIGVAKRVVVVDTSDTRDQLLVFINPTIELKNGRVSSEEGCLSIPDYRESVRRSARITVEYQDLSGAFHKLEAGDLLAICLQHEIDHLNGILFIDHLSRLKREFFRKWLAKQDRLDKEP